MSSSQKKNKTPKRYKDIPPGEDYQMLANIVTKWIFEGLTIKECLNHARVWNSQKAKLLPDEKVEETVNTVFKYNRVRLESTFVCNIEDGCYCYHEFRKGALVTVRISNFIIDLEREIEVYDGYDRTRIFEGEIKGKDYTRNFKIDAGAFHNSNKFMEAIGNQGGARAQFQPKNIVKIRLASQQLSKIKQELVLKQFGWMDDDTFLTPSVIINKNGIAINTETKVDLSSAENARFLDVQILKDSLFKEVSKHILEDLLTLQPAETTYPLIGHTFLAPVMRFLSDTSRYVLWLKGITGAGKSFIARLFQCFFGSFIQDSSITSWTSTVNFIQMIGFHFKDAIFLVDDYKKGNIKNQGELTRMIQSFADGTGRGRLNSDSTTQQTRPIRGLMLCTGEDVPESEASILARMLIIDCKNRHQDFEKGSRCLKYRKYYSGVMGYYIPWFIKKGIKSSLDSLVESHVDILQKGIEGEQNYTRIARNLALNFTGFGLFCDLMLDMRIITKKQAEQMREHSLKNLFSLRGRQIHAVKDEQASNIFLSTLSDLIGSGKVLIENVDMGYILHSPVVGFIKKDKSENVVYIRPKIACSEVKKVLFHSGSGLNFSEKTIGEQLVDDEIITECDKGRHQKSVKHKGNTIRVWVIRKSALGLE